MVETTAAADDDDDDHLPGFQVSSFLNEFQ
jgi:hypothetical protein